MPFATRVHRHNLARVGASHRVERIAYRTHHGQRVVVEELGHVGQLVQPDSVLASDGAARCDAGDHDLRHRCMHSRRLVGIGGVVGNVGVQIAVTGVKDIAHLHAVSHRDFVNGAQNFRQPRAGNDRVLHHQ